MCKNSGFRSRIQKSYKKSGIESKNLIIFSESIPNLLPSLLPWAHTDRTDLTGFLCGWKISRRLSAGFLQRLTRIQRNSTRRLFVEICVNSWQKNLRKNIRVIRGICGFKATPQISTNFYKLFVG